MIKAIYAKLVISTVYEAVTDNEMFGRGEFDVYVYDWNEEAETVIGDPEHIGRLCLDGDTPEQDYFDILKFLESRDISDVSVVIENGFDHYERSNVGSKEMIASYLDHETETQLDTFFQ